MKRIKYMAALAISLFLLNSCNTLDIENIYSYDAEKVWNDDKLATAFMTNLYANTFDNWSAGADANSEQINGIYFYPDRINTITSEFKNWNYTNIRLINEAIENVEAGTLTAETKTKLIAEAKFLRAYTYFGMVNYHGGVPYITKAQDKDVDDLFVTRNTTKECFDLIIKDLDEAIATLPNKISSSSSDYGRIDGTFAQAFKGKVLLYKASPMFNPNNQWDNAYWQEAYTANEAAYKKCIDNGSQLVADYGNIYLVENGPEVVFAVINQYPNKTAYWDSGTRPGSESRGNAWACPTWEFVTEFPMKDGKQYDDPTSKYNKTTDELLQSFWENRDPRFDKSIACNGSIYELSGKTGNRQYSALGIAHEMDDFGTNPNAKINSTNLNSATGLFIRKAVDITLKQAEVEQYDKDYNVMRFAEVMLNYAETANETGHMDIAWNMLKQIRLRAGIEPGTDGNYGIEATTKEEMREAILQERNIEFCFEGKRFWDLRRLRKLDRLNNTTKHGIEAIAINSDATEMDITTAKSKADANQLTEDDFRYVLHQIPFSGVKVNTLPEDKYYFFPIYQTSIDKNNNLEQNINWGGTFNPALD
ncbi:MAG: RagB/SusD family nutrient uptake outer membrane protein [Massilibacteroides sp.]|nr:RagB/SusD family nutrient uptake outer membrane protein [Massilibacteroides sp.]